MKWFGIAYGALYESDTEHVPTPVGAPCQHCREIIAEGDDGVLQDISPIECIAFHYECHMRGIIGGFNHLRGFCLCCGGSEPPDPPTLTRREAARWALAYFEKRIRKADKRGAE